MGWVMLSLAKVTSPSFRSLATALLSGLFIINTPLKILYLLFVFAYFSARSHRFWPGSQPLPSKSGSCVARSYPDRRPRPPEGWLPSRANPTMQAPIHIAPLSHIFSCFHISTISPVNQLQLAYSTGVLAYSTGVRLFLCFLVYCSFRTKTQIYVRFYDSPQKTPPASQRDRRCVQLY